MAESHGETGPVFDVDRIRQLVELMQQHDLSEIDLREADQRIRLARGGSVVIPPAAPAVYAAPSAVPAPAGQAAPAPPPAAAEDGEHIKTITSPMVGTFYARPNPNSDPYVKVGTNVDPETTVCIIEAMKVYNEIPAEVRGQIVAVLVENEESVEFGKPMFKVDTSK